MMQDCASLESICTNKLVPMSGIKPFVDLYRQKIGSKKWNKAFCNLGKSITFKRKAKENDVTEVVLALIEDILPV